MLAMRARQAASYNTDESFHYYVDPSGGSDSGAGSKAAPFQTIGKALGIIGTTAGKSIGLKCGTVCTENPQITAHSTRIGSYGPGALPEIRLGSVVSGFSVATNGSNLLTNPGFETANTTNLVANPGFEGSFSSNAFASWTTNSGTVEHSSSVVHSGTYSAELSPTSSVNAQIYQTLTSLTAGATYTLSFWHQEDTAAKQAAYRVEVMNGAQSGKWLQSGGTYATSPSNITLTTSLNSWVQVTQTFTLPSDCTSIEIWFSNYSSGPFNYYIDDVSLLGSPLFPNWTVNSGAVEQSTSVVHSGNSAAELSPTSSVNAQIYQTLTGLSAGSTYTVSFYHQEDTSGRQAAYRVEVMNGSQQFNWLQSNGTYASSPSNITLSTSLNTWTQVSQTFTLPSDCTSVAVWFSNYSSGPFNYYIDDVSLASGPGISTTTGTYYATCATQPGAATFTTGGSVQLLLLGPSATAPNPSNLGTNQWGWANGALFINLGGTNPSTGTVTAATTGYVGVTSFNYPVFRKVAFTYGQDRTLYIHNSLNATLDRCTFQYSGSVADSGTVSFSTQSTGFRVTRCTFTSIYNDGVAATGGCSNGQIDRNTMYGIYGIQSDGVQIDDTNFVINNSWIHHNSITMDGAFGTTDSPKSSITVGTNSTNGLATGTGAIVEYNSCEGGHSGVGCGQSQMIVRHNTCKNSNSVSYAAGIYLGQDHDLDSIQIYNNLIINGYSGIVGPGAYTVSRKRTNLAITHNTFVAGAQSVNGLSFSASDLVGGTFENNIVYGTLSGAGVEAKIAALYSGATWTQDYNVIGPDQSNGFNNQGSVYSSLAAWASGSGHDTHSVSSNPQFNNAAAGDYTLTTGSPAIGTASDGGNIGAF